MSLTINLEGVKFKKHADYIDIKNVNGSTITVSGVRDLKIISFPNYLKLDFIPNETAYLDIINQEPYLEVKNSNCLLTELDSDSHFNISLLHGDNIFISDGDIIDDEDETSDDGSYENSFIDDSDLTDSQDIDDDVEYLG